MNTGFSCRSTRGVFTTKCLEKKKNHVRSSCYILLMLTVSYITPMSHCYFLKWFEINYIVI